MSSPRGGVGLFKPSFPRSRLSNSRKSIEENFGCILNHATTTTTKKMKHFLTSHGNVAVIMTSFELLKGVVVKISEPSYTLIHPSLSSLSTSTVSGSRLQSLSSSCLANPALKPTEVSILSNSIDGYFGKILRAQTATPQIKIGLKAAKPKPCFTNKIAFLLVFLLTCLFFCLLVCLPRKQSIRDNGRFFSDSLRNVTLLYTLLY